jgi:hypothetical protein
VTTSCPWLHCEVGVAGVRLGLKLGRQAVRRGGSEMSGSAWTSEEFMCSCCVILAMRHRAAAHKMMVPAHPVILDGDHLLLLLLL